MIRSDIDWEGLRGAFAEAQPFPHVVIDDFFEPGVAEALERDIPAFDDPSWMQYSNPIEEKRALNHWDRFPAATYRVFAHLNAEFLASLRALTASPFSRSVEMSPFWQNEQRMLHEVKKIVPEPCVPR